MLRKADITILVENRVERSDLTAEDGLSLFVETPECDVLFDTGRDGAFLKNAEKLGINLAIKTNYVVFSHGHRDHTGGIKAFLEQVKSAKILCHYNIFNRKFRITDGGRLEVGIPFEENDLVKLGGDFIYKTHPYNLTKNIMITGEIPRKNDFEKPFEKHQQLAQQSYITDELHDDMALVLRTTKGLIVLVGDCHSGVINTLEYAMEIAKTNHIYCLMGGMNLHDAPEERINKTVERLKEIKPDYIVPLHSTGFRAINKMYNAFGNRVLALDTGDRFTFDADRG